jgi:AraC-like DNA-binding protein
VPRGIPPAETRPWPSLLATCARLRFDPHDIAPDLDPRGHYDLPLDEEFPCSIKLFHYTSRQHTRGATWHERLELFVPLDGRTIFRLGTQDIDLAAGDLLAIDGMTRHHVVDFEGFDTRAVVVSFEPQFVYSLGSPSHDYAFLMPFHVNGARRGRVLSLRREPEPARALERLLRSRFEAADSPVQRAGSKAFLLQLLFEIAARCEAPALDAWAAVRQEQRSLRLKPLFEHVRDHYADKFSVADAASLVDMSPPQFMKTFKKVAGVTLVAYLNHVRLANGSRLLRETGMTVADVASAVGFSDQSYFDRRFKRAFGQTPIEFRTGGRHPDEATTQPGA